MLHQRYRIIPFTLLLLAAGACDRLPLSLGQGIDDALDGDDSSGGNSVAGTGGAGAGSSVAGTGGSVAGPGTEACETPYVACLESGADPFACRDTLSACEEPPPGQPVPGTAGSAGTGGAPATPDPTNGGYPAGSAGTGGAPATPDPATGGYPAGSAGTGGAPATPDPTTGGYPAGTAGRAGAGGAPASEAVTECITIFELCIESGEIHALCRDGLVSCAERTAAPAGTAVPPGAAGAAGSRAN